MNEQQARQAFILGLDLGSESVGWVVLPCEDGNPTGIWAAGVHCFDAGVEGDYESGRDESRAKARRDARMVRRQHWRRAWRRQKLLRALQRHGLMPTGPTDTPEAIHRLILDLDSSLRGKYPPTDRPSGHVLPYQLRAKALDQRLEPYELGRALYHLAQRRGFLSNRKGRRNKDEEGEVKKAISELQAKIHESGARTLGEYLSKLDPEVERIRWRWTARQMYLDEFDAIWSAQMKHQPALNDAMKDEIHNAIFFQRPLRSQSHLIGECELIPGRRRAPMALRIAQRFRLLQAVNNLVMYLPDGEYRGLTADERARLVEALSTEGDLTFGKVRDKRHLNLPKGTVFNLEEGGEKRLPGNRTDAALIEVFGDRWKALSEADKDRIVEDVLSFEKSEPLARRGREAWGLDAEAARNLAELDLEPGYARHCAKALNTLVRRMEEGIPYATARKEAFPEQFESTEPVSLLPPVREAVPDVRNPAVCRALTELRKVVNAIIRRYGKPEKIRIELARDLKRPRKQRQEASKRMRENESRRAAAKRKILAEVGITQPSASDIEKVLLAEECGWTCPYTGRMIRMQALLGRNPEFDIEHILPMSRSLDNTYFNKTLCYHEENRNRKHNLTPFEAYAADAERWDQILERVKRFQGDAVREKLRRFQMTEIPADWTERQLQDTRYTSRLAGKYLACLYGGRSDADHTQRIQVNSGGVTAHVRNELMLNSILNDGGRKTRNDHRHHAVDAIAIALAGPAIVKQLADAAQRAAEAGRRLFAPIPEPWAGFLDHAREAIGRVNVSRRVNHKISGPLHEESLYSSPQVRVAGKGKVVTGYHIRKPLAKLSKDEIECIVDPVVRDAVKAKLRELNGTEGSVFAVPEHCPVLRSRDGRERPIRKARIRKSANIVSIGEGPRQRYVAPGSNHHMAIVAYLDATGQETRWEGHLVSRLEAVGRHRRGEAVVKRDWGPGKRFRFTLAPGDMFTMTGSGGERILCVARSISEGRVEFVRATDARLKTDIKKAKEWLVKTPDSLRKAGCQKVAVSYLGEIVPCND